MAGVVAVGNEAAAGGSAGRAGSRIEDLWDRYAATRDEGLRNQLTVHYASLAKFVANRVAAAAPPHVELADLVSHGMIGLIDAIERFDVGRGVEFQSYAMRRIRGAILDGMRSGDWAPRSVRRKARAIERATDELSHGLHRAPTPEEVAAGAAMTLSDYHSARTDVARAGMTALHDLTANEDHAGGLDGLGTQDPAGTVEELQLRRDVRAVLRSAADRDRTVLTLYYFEGLTLAEIGEVLGVTEGRVCQIHAAALARLRLALMARRGAEIVGLAG